MDPRERFAPLDEALRLAIRADRAGLWTAIPGIVQSFDPVKVTVVVQPSIQGVVRNSDGSSKAVNLPLLPDVPVCFQRGGGCTLTFPIAQGDECLVIFSSRCIDGWWQSGGIQLPMEPRIHDLSDGFAIVGPQSQAKKISGISTTAVQLRSDDGLAHVQLNPASHDIAVVTPGNVAITAGGNLNATVSGSLTANVTGNSDITTPTLTVHGALTVTGLTTLAGGVVVS